MAYKRNADKILMYTTGFLTVFGLVMVYSASSVQAASHYGMSYYYFVRQLLFAGFGCVGLIFMMNVDYHIWQKTKVINTLLVICALTLAFVFTQRTVNNAHRWIRYGILSFQPSEIAKLIVIIYIAAYLHKHEKNLNDSLKALLPFFAVIGVYVGLIAKEPDFGQAFCILAIAGTLLFIAGFAWRYFVGIAVLIIPASYFCFIFGNQTRTNRIKTFLEPLHDPLGSGWQGIQALTAVGTGGWTGLGLGASVQKLFFLPEASSDFIFAVIGEELGLIGTIVIAAAFLLFFFRGIRIILRSQDRFGFYLGLGITLTIVLQAFINISMVIKLMPTKGIALPFISQGGSSLLFNLLAAGVLLNISKHGKTEAAE